MKFLSFTLFALLTMFASAPVMADDYPTDIFQNTKREVRLEKKKAKAEAIAKRTDSLLSARSFVFVAEKAVTSFPGHSYVSLSGEYDVMVSADTLVSHLPFYGRMYSAQMGPSESPLSFSATGFQYLKKGAAKGKEQAFVMIKAIAKGVQCQISIEVFDTATATLKIQMQNGSSSTFYGYIEPIKHN